MSQKILGLHEALEQAGIPHAFGGAIAVDYYRVPRATVDIDLNIFVSPNEHGRLLEVLGERLPIEGLDEAANEITVRGQGKVQWGETRIDLFFADSPFHYSMADRARSVEYGGGSIPILSAEDIVTVKVVFDRTQDWADIEAVCSLLGSELDLGYIRSWLAEIIGADDPRVGRVAQLVEGTG